MDDLILKGFLKYNKTMLYDLTDQSDVLTVVAEKGDPPDHYLCHLENIEYLVQDATGRVHISDQPILVEIRIPPSYLKSTDPHLGMRVVGLGSPIYHPNVRGSLVCLGDAFMPGTAVHEIARMVYEVVSYQMVTADESNAFNCEACRFVRDNPELIQNLRHPPLRRRKTGLKARVCSVPADERDPK